ncbi:helix-turn-helix domain-containing protein [Limibacter armeniacum]|uniref:helix-turn-helix domain-containing protein n=1 Tax=Limibacter armeniacum TaxID=466084 RepID=UPI002FE5480A
MILSLNTPLRSFHHLTKAQRMAISLFLQMGRSQAVIAQLLGVHRSTICREVKRNSVDGIYDPFKAEQLYQARLFVRGSARKPGVILPNLFPRKAAALPYGRVCTAWHADYEDHYLRQCTGGNCLAFRSPSFFKLREKPIQPRLNRPNVRLLLSQWKKLVPRARDFQTAKPDHPHQLIQVILPQPQEQYA